MATFTSDQNSKYFSVSGKESISELENSARYLAGFIMQAQEIGAEISYPVVQLSEESERQLGWLNIIKQDDGFEIRHLDLGKNLISTQNSISDFYRAGA